MLADLSLATRLTMVTLIPVVAFMTVGGPAIGSALFAYGKFGEVDANYLGIAIALSAFTLIPYALVLLQLRVFYAREQPWTPILIIVAITGVKIAASLLAPHLTDDKELVAGYLGAANGIGFLAGAVLGYLLLRRSLNPPRGRLLDLDVVRTILVTTAAALLAGLVGHLADRLLGLAGADGPRRRRGVAAAAAGARADHAADHRRGDARRPGARRGGRLGRRQPSHHPNPTRSRNLNCNARPASCEHPGHVP